MFCIPGEETLLNSDKLKEFEPVFFPRSIAVVGASGNPFKFGHKYFQGLVKVGFQGGLYPVNPNESQVCGLTVYPSVRDVPGPVEYVIVCVPARYVLSVLDDCAAKGVKVVQFFTAGFSETGEEEDQRLEAEMVEKARRGGFRIIGPNCIGVYSPANRMPFGPSELLGECGTVGVISQSGGHAGRVIGTGVRRWIHFSKVVSFGNGADLDSVDYLEYFAADPDTRIIGAYLEGVKDGRRFFELARQVSRSKPMVVWKGGKTAPGAEAAASHTGSLAIRDTVWDAMLKQAGVVRVDSLEELCDTMLTFQDYPPFLGENVAIVAGLAGGGGGESVSSTDACASAGLKVPAFADETRRNLKAILPPAGCILRNPLDMGASGGILEVLERTMEIVLGDPGVDAVIVNEHIDNLLMQLPKDTLDAMNDVFIRARARKPLVVVSSPTLGSAGAVGMDILSLEKKLADAQVPVYPSLDRAARAIANMNWYYGFHCRSDPVSQDEARTGWA
ncbi:MAG: acetate--CoA ligase family protein [Chloroflexota bacterium]|nr:acetate--CoA ligase family protein [Chloroflexota bacterium]